MTYKQALAQFKRENKYLIPLKGSEWWIDQLEAFQAGWIRGYNASNTMWSKKRKAKGR